MPLTSPTGEALRPRSNDDRGVFQVPKRVDLPSLVIAFYRP